MDNLLKEECWHSEETAESYTNELYVANQKLTEDKYITTRLTFPGASQLINHFHVLRAIYSSQ